MTAQEARQAAQTNLDNLTTIELELIINSVKKAIANGNFSVYIDPPQLKLNIN